mmetsp:Transcript_5548/g.7654  ORF Transcript_5548/g.7654 Transcript_5548/m.7654 type:complete len:475 (+) Transcript_5548:172-1596(+)
MNINLRIRKSRFSEVLRKSKKIFPDLLDMAQFSVLKNQFESVVREGISEIAITVGFQEYMRMKQQQFVNNLNLKPTLKKLEKDLSGDKKHMVYVWIGHSRDRNIITSIRLLKAIPATQKTRQKMYLEQGEELIVHSKLKMELVLKRELKYRLAAPIISHLCISSSMEEARKYDAKGFKMIEPGLVKFGLDPPSAFWVKEHGDPGIPKLLDSVREVFKEKQWFTSEIERIVEKYAISPDALEVLRGLFNRMDRKKEGLISIDQLCRFFGEPQHKIIEWLLELVGCFDIKCISFEQYLSLIYIYCMFTRSEMLRFLFNRISEANEADVDESKFITKKSLHQLMAHLTAHEAVPMNRKKYEMAFDQHALVLCQTTGGTKIFNLLEVQQKVKRLEEKEAPGLYGYEAPPRIIGEPKLYFSQFEKIIESFPVLMYSTQRLQSKIMLKCLGEDYWNAHRDLFKFGRTKAGVALKNKTGPR